MTYSIRRNARASRDIRDFIRYLQHEAGDEVAAEHVVALGHELHTIANRPYAFTWFHETGEPYRAKLFRLARSRYWIIYTVNEPSQSIEITRLWHSAREPGTHGL